MDLKDARSRLATARTALQKADSIISLCEQMEKYTPSQRTLEMLRREVHQQVGRINLLYETLQAIEHSTVEDE